LAVVFLCETEAATDFLEMEKWDNVLTMRERETLVLTKW
jgi:hypothetical protein